jgi:TPR repeat protein
MYIGKLGEQQQDTAAVWFKFAADRGDASGKWNLALCYDKGIGVAPDSHTAQRLRSEASHSPPVNPSVYFFYFYDIPVYMQRVVQ